jgi:alkane 1-monooxygenase
MAAFEGALGRLPGARTPARAPPGSDVLLYALVGLYFVNQVLLLRSASLGGFFRCDTLAAFQFFGVYSAFSGIVLGHELLHRREWYHHLVGRLICCTLLYEHFSTEHLRGHHVRGATEEDAATARFGETYWQFLRRSVPGQWRSAFQLEARRVHAAGVWDWRHLRNRVVQGALLQLALLAGILQVFGPAAVGVFVVQAVAGVCYLEAVNYFQHWGLRRAGRTWLEVDAWETDVRFSVFAMFALPLHADHHMRMVRPYPLLQHSENSPRLPRGYLGTILLTLFANRSLRDYMSAELARKGLGPFARRS